MPLFTLNHYYSVLPQSFCNTTVRCAIEKDQLFTQILDEFLDTEGRVTLASTTVHLVETLVFDVRVLGGDGKKD